MQMALILSTGVALAATPQVKRLLETHRVHSLASGGCGRDRISRGRLRLVAELGIRSRRRRARRPRSRQEASAMSISGFWSPPPIWATWSGPRAYRARSRLRPPRPEARSTSSRRETGRIAAVERNDLHRLQSRPDHPRLLPHPADAGGDRAERTGDEARRSAYARQGDEVPAPEPRERTFASRHRERLAPHGASRRDGPRLRVERHHARAASRSTSTA